MATGSSSLAITKNTLPQLPKEAEMVMTTCWFPKELTVTTGSDPAEMDDVSSSTKEPPVQQTTFSAGELVTGQLTHHFKI